MYLQWFGSALGPGLTLSPGNFYIATPGRSARDAYMKSAYVDPGQTLDAAAG